MTLTVAMDGFSDSDRAAAEDEGLHLDSRLRDALEPLMGELGPEWAGVAEYQQVRLFKVDGPLEYEVWFANMGDVWEVSVRVARGGTAQRVRRGWGAAAALLVCVGVLGGVAELMQSGWVLLGLPLVFVPSLVLLRQDPTVQTDERATRALSAWLRGALDSKDWVHVLSGPGLE